MAGQFGYLAVSKWDVEPPIACSGYIVYFIKGQISLPQRLFHYLVGQTAMLGTGIALNTGDQVLILINNRHLGHGGT